MLYFVCFPIIYISVEFTLIKESLFVGTQYEFHLIQFDWSQLWFFQWNAAINYLKYFDKFNCDLYSLPQLFHNKLNNFTPDFDFSRSRHCYCCWFPVFRVKNSQKMYLIIDSPGLTRLFFIPAIRFTLNKQTNTKSNQFAICKWISSITTLDN